MAMMFTVFFVCAYVFVLIYSAFKKRWAIAITGILTLLYLPMILMPLLSCNGICSGHNGMAWFPAFFFFPVGIPATLAFFIMLINFFISWSKGKEQNAPEDTAKNEEQPSHPPKNTL